MGIKKIDDAAAARFRAIPFFAGVSDDLLDELRPNLCERLFKTGDLILQSAQYCDGAYFLTKGVVEVRFAGGSDRVNRLIARVRGQAVGFEAASTDEKRELGDETTVLSAAIPDPSNPKRAFLEAGDIFGEMSALARHPVGNDIVAFSDVSCWFIDAAALRKLFAADSVTSFKAFFDTRYRERSLAAVLRRNGLFADVDEQTLARLRAKAELISFEDDETIAEEGAEADAFYLIRGGFVRVSSRTPGGEVVSTYLRRGDTAGETAILIGHPWPFTLKARRHVELVKIAKADIVGAIGAQPRLADSLWSAVTTQLKARGVAIESPAKSESIEFAMTSGVVHGESVLLIDLHACTRCDDCVRACADVHGGEKPRFAREGLKFGNFSVPTSCFHCLDPVCMSGCPTNAISRPYGTREVTVNEETCIGCGACSRLCPWGNIHGEPFDSPTLGRQINLATKCDLCVGRADGPACVQMCPHGAAIRVNFQEATALTRLAGIV